MIEINDVTKQYNDFTAIEGISCNIDEGSILGLIGYNGAGKTTLLKSVCGVLKPERGTITLDGQPIYDNAQAKGRLFFVSDDPYILPQASMKRMAQFYRGYYPKWNDTVFNKLVNIFKLDVGKRMSGFSKGMQRQAFIIFALSASPDYLLLDEAFDGIDPMMRDLVRQLLLEAIGRGVGVVISSHNLRELEDLCDKICVLNGKRIVYIANIDDIRMTKNKYRLMLPEDMQPEAVLRELGINYKNLQCSGRIVTFVADGNADEIRQSLAEKSPLLMESLPLSLEEIFLIEMEAKNYDFSDLFN